MRITPIYFNNFNRMPCIKNRNEGNKTAGYYFGCTNAQAVFNISFGYKQPVPVYRIDKDLDCTYFERGRDAAKDLNVSPQDISACLKGRKPVINGFIFAYPHQIEKKAEDGTVTVDKGKAAKLYNARTQPNAVYSVDYDGSFQKYSSESQVRSKRGNVMVKAADVESYDDCGQVIVDRKKLSAALLLNPLYSAIYSLDESGNYVKHPSQSEYARQKGVSRSAVSNAMVNPKRRVGGEYIIPAAEIETVASDGTIVVDRKKLSEYLSRVCQNDKCYYTVTSDMQLTRYKSGRALAEDNGINYNTFFQHHDRLTPDGKYIVSASEIEEPDENGLMKVNKSKLARIIWEKESEKNLYTIDINGDIEKYKDIKAAAAALDRDEQTVYLVVHGNGSHKTVAGKLVVKASEIEIIDADGNVTVDKFKVTKLIQEKLCPNAVYLVDKNCQCKKFRNRNTIAKILGASASSVTQGRRIYGFSIVDAKYIEEVSEDGGIYLNPDKVAFYAAYSKSSF